LEFVAIPVQHFFRDHRALRFFGVSGVPEVVLDAKIFRLIVNPGCDPFFEIFGPLYSRNMEAVTHVFLDHIFVYVFALCMVDVLFILVFY